MKNFTSSSEKNRRQRMTSALLLLSMLSGGMISCGSVGKEAESSQSSDVVTAAPVEKINAVDADFERLKKDYNFGGKECNLLVREEKLEYMDAEAEVGEPFKDSLYARHRKIEEAFNAKVNFIPLVYDPGLWDKTISDSVLAGDGAYDVVMPDYWWGIETKGYYLDLLTYSNIMDFSQPWWCSGWNDNAEIFGQMYSVVGMGCIELIIDTTAIYFNQKLLENLDLESPYDLVEERKWTIDKMMEMAAHCSEDVNGDGEMNINDDLYGISFDLQSGRALLPSSGWKTTTKQSDGTYAYEFWNDRFITMYDKLYDIFNNSPCLNYTYEYQVPKAWQDDRLLFLPRGLDVARDFREMESDFGIVPYPLFDENQEDYISYNFGTSYMAIPKSAKNPELAAVVLEAFNAEAYNTCKDAFYEVMLKEKVSRDEQTTKMLDLIIDSVYFDFTFVNEAATEHVVMYFFDQLSWKNPDIASAFEAEKERFQAALDKLFETYKTAAEY